MLWMIWKMAETKNGCLLFLKYLSCVHLLSPATADACFSDSYLCDIRICYVVFLFNFESLHIGTFMLCYLADVQKICSLNWYILVLLYPVT